MIVAPSIITIDEETIIAGLIQELELFHEAWVNILIEARLVAE